MSRAISTRSSRSVSRPSCCTAFFVQRRRWCRGGVQVLFLRDGPLGPGLDLMKRLLFFPIYWLVQLPATLLLALMPIVYLWTGVPPLHVASLDDFLGYQLATLLFFALTFAWLAPRSFVPVLTTAIHMFMAIRLAPTALATLIKPFGEPFRVTPKGAAGRRGASDDITASVALLLSARLSGRRSANAFWLSGWPSASPCRGRGGVRSVRERPLADRARAQR